MRSSPAALPSRQIRANVQPCARFPYTYCTSSGSPSAVGLAVTLFLLFGFFLFCAMLAPSCRCGQSVRIPALRGGAGPLAIVASTLQLLRDVPRGCVGAWVASLEAMTGPTG